MDIFAVMMIVFLVFVFLGIPVSFSIGLATIVASLQAGLSLSFMSQVAYTGLNNYTYIAIPMFILAGYLMETGGLSKRLVNFASSLVGNVYGGLGIITVIACAFFAAISGSSPGTVAAVGAMMIPPMIEKGYDRDFSAALTASAGSLGVLIPPSIPMVLYCISGNVSIGDMFMAGVFPGIMVAGALAVTTYVISRKKGYRSDEGKFDLRRVARTLKEAIFPLFAPVIILGGIYSGIFTATEASVIVVIYSLLVGLFITKELKWKDIPATFKKAAITSGTTVFILAFAMGFSKFLTWNQIPQMIGAAILSLTDNPQILLVLFSLMCFVTGTFLETASQVLIYTPLFLPTLKALGVSPLHFGVLLTIGTMLGMMTPPVGVNLFVAQGVSGASVSQMTKKILPFLFVMLGVQILLIFLPDISTFLPGMMAK